MLFLSISPAQEYYEYIGYGASILTMYLLLRASFKIDIKELKSMVSNKVDNTDYCFYKADHEKKHEKESDDIKYVRGKIDEIYKYLLEIK